MAEAKPENNLNQAPEKKPEAAKKPAGLSPTAKKPAVAAKKMAVKKKVVAAGEAPIEESKKDDENVGSLGAVVIRNEFYRDGYRSILKLAVMQSLVILALIAALFFVIHSHQPENRYFATTEDGRLIPMVPLMQPNLSTPALMSWAAQASTEVMTFGFNDYRRRLQEASRNFTRTGWESFTQALQQSRIIEMIETNQQVVTAAPKGAPILVSEGPIGDRYQWQLQLPLVITYQSGSKSNSTSLLVTLVVVRVSRLESPNGVGIEQWIAVPR